MPKSQDPSKMSDYEKLLEMARVFRIPKKEVIKYIHLPERKRRLGGSKGAGK